jgi:hypothetical protein
MSATRDLKSKITQSGHFDADSDLHVLLECSAEAAPRPYSSQLRAQDLEARSDVRRSRTFYQKRRSALARFEIARRLRVSR